MGGFVAQEGLKAITAKFLPLSQWVSTLVDELGWYVVEVSGPAMTACGSPYPVNKKSSS
jgi:hypothetical protein